jgi:hypothetical protein
MIYKENIGLESKEHEYKVFNFNPLKVSDSDALYYLDNKIFVFNESVNETLKNYLEIYLSKYLCSYFHPKSNLSSGYLYFGINDNGKVIGIPYLGNIELNFINYQIDKIFSKLLNFPDENIKKTIRESINIEIIPIDKTNIINNPLHKKSIYSKYIDELNKIKAAHILYKKKRNVWNKMLDLDNLKLSKMINNLETRKVIWEYIKIKSNYSIKMFKNKYSHLEQYCDVDNYWNLMYKIKSNNKFNSLKFGQIVDSYKNNLDIYNWVARWKDSRTSMLKLVKPIRPRKTINSNYPIFLLSRVSKMIPEWIKKNNNLNLYVIKFTFNIKSQHVLEYKDIENRWKKSYRTIKNGEPVSLSYY